MPEQAPRRALGHHAGHGDRLPGSEADVAAIVPDPGKTIDEGAVLPWNAGSRRLYQYAAGEPGVRLDVPYRELTHREKDIVLHGEPVERRVPFESGHPPRTVRLMSPTRTPWTRWSGR